MGSGGGVLAVSACMSGSGDMLEMSVVRGISGVCDMCMFGSGRCGWRGG